LNDDNAIYIPFAIFLYSQKFKYDILWKFRLFWYQFQ